MSRIAALAFDGKTSAAQSVELAADGAGALLVYGTTGSRRYPRGTYRVAPPLGNLRREISCEDGSLYQTSEAQAFDNIFTTGARGQRLVDRWERHLGYALLAGGLTIAVVWSTIQFGIPKLAERVAFALPPTTEAKLGADALAALDKLVFKPTKLSAADQQRLQRLFGQVKTYARDPNLRLELRSGGALDANAFALPSGTIVMTDELVALAKRDEELLAVLAHEAGHVARRHTLRQVLQNSAVTLFVAVLSADPVSASSLAATLPTMMVQMKFSRAFELEADAYASGYMTSKAMSPAHLANMLRALAHEAGERPDESSFLSTHPATSERIKLLEQKPTTRDTRR